MSERARIYTAMTHTGNEEFDRVVDIIEPFIRHLFEQSVLLPMMTSEQRTLAASRIACAVVDAGQPHVHVAYNRVRNQLRAMGDWPLP